MDDLAWAGIRPHTLVLVHHGPRLGLVEGTVSFVTRPRSRPNEVGVRLAGGAVVWPSPGDVHSVPRTDDPATCWRCRAGSPT